MKIKLKGNLIYCFPVDSQTLIMGLFLCVLFLSFSFAYDLIANCFYFIQFFRKVDLYMWCLHHCWADYECVDILQKVPPFAISLFLNKFGLVYNGNDDWCDEFILHTNCSVICLKLSYLFMFVVLSFSLSIKTLLGSKRQHIIFFCLFALPGSWTRKSPSNPPFFLKIFWFGAQYLSNIGTNISPEDK